MNHRSALLDLPDNLSGPPIDYFIKEIILQNMEKFSSPLQAQLLMMQHICSTIEKKICDIPPFGLSLDEKINSLLLKQKKELQPLDMVEAIRIKGIAKEMRNESLMKRVAEQEKIYFSDAITPPEWLKGKLSEIDKKAGSLSLEEAEKRIGKFLDTLKKEKIDMPEPVIKYSIKRLLDRTSWNLSFNYKLTEEHLHISSLF